MPEPVPRRRLILASLVPVLQACAAPLATMQAAQTTPGAAALLAASAAAHGLPALEKIADISVSYAGQWRGLVNRLQPALVDEQYRRASQERLLLRDRLVAQAHTGPGGHKQAVRRATPGTPGDIRVWINGVETEDPERQGAAALVVDGYSLFLLGPMLLAGSWAADRTLLMEVAGDGTQTVDGRPCDVLRVRMAPGLGFAEADQLALFIDREDRLMRRVRFTLNGLDSTRGAIAEVDTGAHVALHGIRWPTSFHERLLRPFPLPVHDWALTGLDVDRGLTVAEVAGPSFAGRAITPAAELGPQQVPAPPPGTAPPAAPDG